ncbi:AI-2E family transporter [Roseomonas terrae]|jgi:predicted PurR-regulated permease PerM|uniref:AI-2E family transporter n=1 Tax=Neoroseomonas terrae TaxID=424799 RepID=A0ABS5EKN4_9PROT|nr:AI-2E family transporter [Neoroseomonas terrae]MBR0651589.1 AI-2E family transporter [Neoroseomonas terrae]
MAAESDGQGGAPQAGHAGTVLIAERAAVLLMLALLLYGVGRVLEPFALAIALGAFIAIGTWPAREALVSRGVRPALASMVLLLVLILAVALPATLIVPDLGDQVVATVTVARNALERLSPTPPAWVTDLPLVGSGAGRLWAQLEGARGNFTEVIRPYSGAIASMLVSLGQAAAASLMQILLSLLVAAMCWTGGDRTVAQLREIAGRLGGQTGIDAVDAAGGAVRGVAWGVVGTGLIQGVLMGVGLAIAGVPGAVVLGFLAMIFSISQVLGPLIVVMWLAAAAWLYSQGSTGWAIFMVVWGLVPVSGSDNIVRPLLIQRGSAMPLGLIIIGVFGGMIAFGFLGLFVGPALLAVAHGLLQAWRQAGVPARGT